MKARNKKSGGRNPLPARANDAPGPPAPEGSPTERTRRQRWILFALVCVISGCVATFFLWRTYRVAHLPPARDIILITIDTTRAGALGYAGNTRVKTPFIDSLAGRGIIF